MRSKDSILGRPSSHKPAIVMSGSGTTVTFGQLDEGANRLARFLRNHGLRPGDTVALLMDNNEHVHVAMWAAKRTGLYFAPINSHLTAAEVAHVIVDCEAKALVSSRALRDTCVALPEHLPDGLPEVRLIADDELPGWSSYPACVAGESGAPISDECDGQLLQFSGGSTGRPRGIRRPMDLAPGKVTVPSTPVFEALGVTGDSVYLSPAPLYHTAPAMWTMCAQAVGATTVVMERFDAAAALAAIDRHGVTHAQFVPTMFVRMLRLPDAERRRHRLTSLRRVVHASAPCPPDVKRQMIDWWGPIIDEYYGNSEGSGITFIRAREWLERPGSVGRPLLGTPHVLDEHGVEVPVGEEGDVYFDGGYPFEYLNDEVKTTASRGPGGWTTVGDVGYLDADGYLYLTDRRHNMIISGGVNVYPQEAENALVSHPLVADAAVFGIPDADLGQTVVAVVELADPSQACDRVAADLMASVRERLARYKCPRVIAFEERLPRTDAGKLNKQPLIERFLATANEIGVDRG